MNRTFANFHDFYRFYLSEHQHPVSRRLHFAGTTLVVIILIAAIVVLVVRSQIISPFQRQAENNASAIKEIIKKVA